MRRLSALISPMFDEKAKVGKQRPQFFKSCFHVVPFAVMPQEASNCSSNFWRFLNPYPVKRSASGATWDHRSTHEKNCVSESLHRYKAVVCKLAHQNVTTKESDIDLKNWVIRRLESLCCAEMGKVAQNCFVFRWPSVPTTCSYWTPTINGSQSIDSAHVAVDPQTCPHARIRNRMMMLNYVLCLQGRSLTFLFFDQTLKVFTKIFCNIIICTDLL